MTSEIEILTSLKNLESYVKNNRYSGFDPYDALNSQRLSSLQNKILKLIATQMLVYSPIDIRHFLDIKSGENPKAIGIFLLAYCKMFKQNLITNEEFEKISNKFVDLLIQHRSSGYSEYCWGFNFNWQDLHRFAKKGLPTIVVTTYVAHAFLDLYEITKNKKYLDIARSSCEFILKDLHITKTDEGLCFSYTPIDIYVVHNANALGASLLSRMYSHTKETILRDYSTDAFNFLLSHQKQDGSWAYSKDIKSGKERNQTDFHQGFILDSLCDYIKYIDPHSNKYSNALTVGSEFYLTKQFDKSGYAYWRLPHKWPIDIHNQAQGIITSCKLYQMLKTETYRNHSTIILDWTLHNMHSPAGYFYYQKWPIITNKISYIRWGQAWMLLALANYSNLSNKGRKFNE